MTQRTMKTLDDIRADLSEDIDRIRSGETTPAVVNAVVAASSTILRSVKMEMDYARMTGRTPAIPFLEGK